MNQHDSVSLKLLIFVIQNNVLTHCDYLEMYCTLFYELFIPANVPQLE